MSYYLNAKIAYILLNMVSSRGSLVLPSTQLIPFIDDLAEALGLNNSIRTDVIYFDFAKAFDSVNHDVILHKLKFVFNVDGLMLKFLTNYLQNRKQRVVVDQSMSIDANVLSGVPQGSILGPLLFVLLINDVHSVVSPETNISLSADGTKIWRQISSDIDSEILNLLVLMFGPLQIS